MSSISHKRSYPAKPLGCLSDRTNLVDPSTAVVKGTGNTMNDNSALNTSKTRTMASNLLPTRGGKSILPGEQLRWVGMTPLEWIESLNAKAEAEEAFKMRKPLSVNFSDKSFYKQSPISFHKDQKPATSTPTKFVGDKRRRETPDAVISTSTVVSSSASNPVGNFPFPHQMPMYWDFSFLERCPLVERIRLLVLTVESQLQFLSLRVPFERTRDHFAYSVGYIRHHDPNPRVQLESLYHETIHKLQALLDLAKKEELEEAAPPNPPSSPLDKIDLGKYMTNWLRENWINPYPDETVLQQISRDCGTTPHIVTNWLINARTRKWRPAIMKAYEMNRPAELLLEDSIAIFDGKPLHSLDSDDTEESPPKRARHA
jgi:hypothetical protein